MQFDIAHHGDILSRTPAILRSMLDGLDQQMWTHADYGTDTWSAHDIVGHLVFGDQTDWIPRARIILNQGEAQSFEPFDRTGHRMMCKECSLDDHLDLFTSLRAENLATLKTMPITEETLALTGVHPAFGTVTLNQLLCAWVVHDLHHIGHISKAIAHQLKDEVGPWAAYLSILDSPAPR